jgi:hypothetical protein
MGIADINRPVAVFGVIGAALLWVTVAGAAPGDPKKELRPGDQAKAASVLLQRHDLPAGRWLAEPTDFSQPNPACLVRHYSLASLTATGEAGHTYTLAGGLTVVESDAHVFLSDRQGTLGYAILTNAGLARCLGSSFANAFGKGTPGVSGKLMNVEPLRLAGVHGAPARGFRIFVRLRSVKGDMLAEIVLVGIHRGRAVGSLSLIKVADGLSMLKNRALWPDSVVSSLAEKVAMRIARH